MTLCSWRAGWRSVLLRAYDEPGAAEEFTTAPTSDQLIVLVTAGCYPIEARHRGGWRKAQYSVGSIGMTAAGEEATLRWRGGRPTTTLHLHLASQTMRAAAEALWGRDPRTVEMRNALDGADPLIQQVMLTLRRAVLSGAPDLYAETAAGFLAAHLLWTHAGFAAPEPARRDDGRMRRADAYLREHLGEAHSLDRLAHEAGLSRFHFLRMFKQAYGETPFRRLTRLRIEQARRLLGGTDEQVSRIAFRCGYDDPAHFASAFRRAVGVPPMAYRRQSR